MNQYTIEVLNDLIRINNDRIEGYQKASQQIENEDVDLRALFGRMAEQSMQYRQQLTENVVQLGGSPENDTRIDGKLFRMWMEIRATFTGNSRESALSSCERGEDAILRAYDEALGSDAEIGTSLRQLLVEQKNGLRQSHDVIKKYRDMHQKVDA